MSTIILLNKWARRLEADEMTIHRDGSITLMCTDGYIYIYVNDIDQLVKKLYK